MAIKRTGLQVRPRGSDGPLYNPQRDLAYVYAPAMREALRALDQVNWTSELRGVIDQLGITEEDISVAVGKLTEAHRYFVGDDTVQEPVDALNKVGWYDVKPGARYLIYGRLGEVMLGGFFIALRDVTAPGQGVLQGKEICDLVAAGKLVMERGSGKVETTTLAVVTEEKASLSLQLEALQQAMHDALQRNNDLVRQAQATEERHRKEALELQGRLSTMISEAGNFTLRSIEAETRLSALQSAFVTSSLWQRVCWLFNGARRKLVWCLQICGEAINSQKQE